MRHQSSGRSASPPKAYEDCENTLIAYRRILHDNQQKILRHSSPKRNVSPKLRRNSLKYEDMGAQPNKETDDDEFSTPVFRRTKSLFVTPNHDVDKTPNDQG
jgi:hypothetical protein